MVSPIPVIRDQNHIPIWWGVSSVDGITLVPIQMNTSNGGVMVEDGVSVMPVMAALKTFFERDSNYIPCIGGQSSTNANVIIPVSVNPATGAIMVQTT